MVRDLTLLSMILPCTKEPDDNTDHIGMYLHELHISDHRQRDVFWFIARLHLAQNGRSRKKTI